MIPAVVLSAHTMGLGVVRALGARGVPLAVVHYRPEDYAHHSKFVLESFPAPHPETDPEGFWDVLCNLPQSWQGSVLIPTADETLMFTARHKKQLARHFQVACPEFETVRQVIEKHLTYSVAAQAGISVPRTVVVHSEKELYERREEIVTPCLVKPSQSHLYYARFGVKMHLVQTWDELLRQVGRAMQAGLEVMLQEYVPGGDDTVWNYNALVVEGQPTVEFTALHIRNAPSMLGSPRVALSHTNPELIQTGRKLMQALSFTGFACTEFKYDQRDGRLKLMEVNARHNLSTLLAVKCGINFPWLEYRFRAYGEIPLHQDFKTGVYWIDLTRDFIYSLGHFRSERYRPGYYLRPYLGPKCWAILDLRDPRPFLRRLAILARQAVCDQASKTTDRGAQAELHLKSARKISWAGNESGKHSPKITGPEEVKMVKEWIPCNCCGADDYRVLSEANGWPIGQCNQCGMIYVNPAPFFEPCREFSELSKGFQYTRYMHDEITPAILRHEHQQLVRHGEEIKAMTNRNTDQIRFLDVGCGSGAAIKAALDLGWHATGMDIDPALIETGRHQFEGDLRCATLLDAGFPANEFDFIRLRDVIEHLPNPYAALMEIKRILKPGGILLVATPNEAGLPTRLRLLLGSKRSKVATVEPPHHLHGFTPDTLRQIFLRAGFKVITIFTTTPTNPDYVTSNNMRQVDNRLFGAIWEGARRIGMGSMLISWGSRS